MAILGPKLNFDELNIEIAIKMWLFWSKRRVNHPQVVCGFRDTIFVINLAIFGRFWLRMAILGSKLNFDELNIENWCKNVTIMVKTRG